MNKEFYYEKSELDEDRLAEIKVEGTEFSLFEYLYGRCHIFAQAHHLATGSSITFLWDEEAEFEGGKYTDLALSHAYVVLPNGEKVDARGILTDIEIEINYETNEPSTETISMETLEHLYLKDVLEKPSEVELNSLIDYIKKSM